QPRASIEAIGTRASPFAARGRFSCVAHLPNTRAHRVLRAFDIAGSAGSEVAHRVAPMLATVRRSNVVCGFPAPRFHEGALFCDAIEGISLTSWTSPYSP